MPRTKDIYFNLLLGDAQYVGNFFVGFALKIAKLHTGALLFGQTVNQLSHQLYAVVLLSVVEGCRCLVGAFHALLVELKMVIFLFLSTVES